MDHEKLSNLQKHDSIYSGAILISNRETKLECLQRKLFGLPYSMLKFIKHIKAGMILFLFEHEERKLYGIFEATSDGALNIVPDAFRSTGRSYPAQVLFRRILMCKPLCEDEFRTAISENYFCPFKFHFGLSYKQVINLIELFSPRKINISVFKGLAVSNKILEECEYSGADEVRFDVRGTYSECKSNEANTKGKRKLVWHSAIPQSADALALQCQGFERSLQHPVDDAIRPNHSGLYNLEVQVSHRLHSNSEYNCNESNTKGNRELGWHSELSRVPINLASQYQGLERCLEHPVDDARRPSLEVLPLLKTKVSHPLHSNSGFKSNESNTKGMREFGCHSAVPRLPVDLALQYQGHERNVEHPINDFRRHSQEDLHSLEAHATYPLHSNSQTNSPQLENMSPNHTSDHTELYAFSVGNQSTNTHGLDYTTMPWQSDSSMTNPDNLGVPYRYMKDSQQHSSTDILTCRLPSKYSMMPGIVDSEGADTFQSLGVVNEVCPRTELLQKTCSPIPHPNEVLEIQDYIPLMVEPVENLSYEQNQNYGLEHLLSTESGSFIPRTIKGTSNGLYSFDDESDDDDEKSYESIAAKACHQDVEGRISVFSRLAGDQIDRYETLKQTTEPYLDELLNILTERRESWSKMKVSKRSIGWNRDERYVCTSARGYNCQSAGRYLKTMEPVRAERNESMETQHSLSSAPSYVEPENEAVLDESSTLPFYNFRRRNVNKKLEAQFESTCGDAGGNEVTPAIGKRRKLLRPSFNEDERQNVQSETGDDTSACSLVPKDEVCLLDNTTVLLESNAIAVESEDYIPL